MSVQFGNDTRNVTGATVTDKITDVDHDRIVYYSTDADCAVSFSTDIGSGFRCRAIVHNSAAGMPIFDSGVAQNRYGKYKASGPGAIIEIYVPGDGNIAISGDLGQVSTIFANLPASPRAGDTVFCTDVTSPECETAGTAVGVGGGSNQCLLFFDGSLWRVLGAQIP